MIYCFEARSYYVPSCPSEAPGPSLSPPESPPHLNVALPFFLALYSTSCLFTLSILLCRYALARAAILSKIHKS